MKVYLVTYEFYDIFEIIGIFDNTQDLIKKVDKFISEEVCYDEEEYYYVYEIEVNDIYDMSPGEVYTKWKKERIKNGNN